MATPFLLRDELTLQAHDRLGLIKNRHIWTDTKRPLRLDPDETIVIDVNEADDYYYYSITTYWGPVSDSVQIPHSSEWRDFDKRCPTTGKYTEPASLNENLRLTRKLLWHGTLRPDSPYDKVVIRTVKGFWTVSEGDSRLGHFFPHNQVEWDLE